MINRESFHRVGYESIPMRCMSGFPANRNIEAILPYPQLRHPASCSNNRCRSHRGSARCGHIWTVVHIPPSMTPLECK